MSKKDQLRQIEMMRLRKSQSSAKPVSKSKGASKPLASNWRAIRKEQRKVAWKRIKFSSLMFLAFMALAGLAAVFALLFPGMSIVVPVILGVLAVVALGVAVGALVKAFRLISEKEALARIASDHSPEDQPASAKQASFGQKTALAHAQKVPLGLDYAKDKIRKNRFIISGVSFSMALLLGALTVMVAVVFTAMPIALPIALGVLAGVSLVVSLGALIKASVTVDDQEAKQYIDGQMTKEDAPTLSGTQAKPADSRALVHDKSQPRKRDDRVEHGRHASKPGRVESANKVSSPNANKHKV